MTLTSVSLQTQCGLSANKRRSLGRSGQWWPLLLLQTGNCNSLHLFYRLSDTVHLPVMRDEQYKVKVWCMEHCYLTQSTGWKYYEVSTHTFYHFDEQAFLSVWKVWTEAVEGQLPRIIKTQIPYKELENFPITNSPVFLDTLLSLYCPRLKCSCSLFATLCVSESIGMNRIFRKIHTKKLWQDYIF